MSSLFVIPKQTPFRSSRALGLAKGYFLQATTTTPAPVYTTAELNIEHDDPVRSDADGLFPAIYLDPNAGYDYRFQLKTDADVLVWDEDNIPASSYPNQAEIGEILNPRTPAEIAASVTPVNYAKEYGNPERQGGVGDGSTTDTTALANTCLQREHGGAVVSFPRKGPWKSGQITLATGNGAVDIHGNGATITLVGNDASAYQWLKVTASMTDLTVRDLRINGDGVAASKQNGVGPSSSAVVVTDAHFDNCKFTNLAVGIDATAMINCTVMGGRVGPTVGTASGEGYGIVGGTNGQKLQIFGTYFYRGSRHLLYFGATIGASVTGATFEEHGHGASPAFLSAFVMARGRNQSAVGNHFIGCIHNPVEISDEDSIAGQFEGGTFSANTFYNCKRPLVIGNTGATVSADVGTTTVDVGGNVWHMPAASDGECIRVYQAYGLNIHDNRFYFPSETIAITAISIDDVAANYPNEVLISDNNAHIETSNGTKCLVYFDTAVCGSSSTAKIRLQGNQVWGGGKLFQSATEIQNANIITDTLEVKDITGATPYVCAFNRFALTQGGATNVTNFLGGYDGHRIKIKAGDGNSTIKATNIYLAGAADFTMTASDELVLEYDGANWREVSRSVN